MAQPWGLVETHPRFAAGSHHCRTPFSGASRFACRRDTGVGVTHGWAKESEVRTHRQLLRGEKVGLPSFNTPFSSLFPSSPKQELQKSPLGSRPGPALGDRESSMRGRCGQLGLGFFFKVNSVLVEGTRLGLSGLKHRASMCSICLVVGWSWVASPTPPGFVAWRQPFKALRNEQQLQTSFLFSAKSHRGPFSHCSRAEASGLGCLQ